MALKITEGFNQAMSIGSYTNIRVRLAFAVEELTQYRLSFCFIVQLEQTFAFNHVLVVKTLMHFA